MNIPIYYILIPSLLGVLLFILQRWERLVTAVGTITSLVLAYLVWWLPDQDFLFIGPWYLNLEDTWFILGRRFVLGADDRPTVMVLYLGAAFWFGAASLARPGRNFVPVGLGILALLTAIIAVEPFLYSALFIVMAVLLSIPILSRPGHPVGKGVLRYLTFQTLGTPFILLSGWILSGVEGGVADAQIHFRALLLMGMGFAFLLAVFPFHSWIPMLAEECHPFTAAFIFLLLPGAITLFGLGFFDQFAWLRNSENSYLWMRLAGVIMVFTAGIWAAVQRHLGRMLGYAALLEIGLSLIAIGLAQGASSREYLGILFAALLPRGVGMGLWALSLTLIWSKTADLSFRAAQGMGRQTPIATSALVLANLSLVGMPLLAAFPVRLVLLEGLGQTSLLLALLALAGCAGLLLGGLRSLSVLVMGKDESSWKVTESPVQLIYLGLGMMALFALGLFPQWFLPFFADLPLMFRNLVP